VAGGAVILAIDPGTTESGWALFDGKRVRSSGIFANSELLLWLLSGVMFAGEERERVILAIEMIASYGMAVGKEVFETCVWIGRFQQAWRAPGEVQLVYRRDVKLFLCGSARAKDPNIRQALLDMLGPQGTKAKPGPTYGVKSHAWAALGVAVTAAARASSAAPAPGLFAVPQERSVDPFAECAA
jgi:hypothetical protein